MMDLAVISPTKKTIASIAWLEINTTVGNFVIQPEHAATVLILAENKPITYCLASGKQETTMIPAGIVEITPTAATIVVYE